MTNEPAHIASLRARLTAAQADLTRLEYADDLAHVSGAYARQEAVVRAAQDELIRAMTQHTIEECHRLARVETFARDAMASAHKGDAS
jgi:hypothetical protein